MALKYGNRVKVKAATTSGYFNFILGVPVTGYQSLAAAIPSLVTGDTFRYVIEDGANWEIGIGTYNSTGPQFARTIVTQSSAGGSTLIDATANAIVMISVAAGDYITNPDAVFSGAITEAVYTLTGTTPTITATNGTIQSWTLTGNSTPVDGLTTGQSINLMITAGATYTVTWPIITWKTDAGVAPTLNISGVTAIVVWKVGSTLYGARVGNA